jgi:hypothetical protein
VASVPLSIGPLPPPPPPTPAWDRCIVNGRICAGRSKLASYLYSGSHENRNSFKTGEPANSGFSRMQLLIVSRYSLVAESMHDVLEKV